MQRLLTVMILAAGAATPANKPKIEASPIVIAAPPAATSKLVQVGDRDVIAITARIRFTTMIILPEKESILDFVCGDKEFWVVNGTGRHAFIKPAKENSQTNLNLITASGNVYTFMMTEGGEN